MFAVQKINNNMKNLMKIAASLFVVAILASSCGEKVNPVEKDAKRMAELACEASKNVQAGIAAGTSMDEVQKTNEALNNEMEEINTRFEAEYANTENEKVFQDFFQEAFTACSGMPAAE